MALTKVTKHIVFGSTLIAHYGRDISDTTSSSSSLTQWGEDIVFTPQYADSHIEICVTGTVFSSTQFTTSDRFGNLAININGTTEYTQNGVIGGRTTQASTRTWHNPRHQQHNGRQQFHYDNFGNSIYMNHIHAPGNTNQLTIEIMMSSDSGHLSIQCKDGFVTVSEISGDHYNKT